MLKQLFRPRALPLRQDIENEVASMRHASDIEGLNGARPARRPGAKTGP